MTKEIHFSSDIAIHSKFYRMLENEGMNHFISLSKLKAEHIKSQYEKEIESMRKRLIYLQAICIDEYLTIEIAK
jgi:hypothetical protein